MRRLTDEERRAIETLAEHLAPIERRSVTTDVSDCQVEEATQDGARLLFHLPGYRRPPYRGQHAYPVSGMVYDDDGTEVSVILHADENNRLFELELIKWGNGPLIKPNWKTFQLEKS